MAVIDATLAVFADCMAGTLFMVADMKRLSTFVRAILQDVAERKREEKARETGNVASAGVVGHSREERDGGHAASVDGVGVERIEHPIP
jgi:hypothetical protein